MLAMRGSVRRVARVWMAALLLAGAGAVIALPTGTAAAATGCRLGPGGSIKHVIIVQFDNVHLARDNPNVPSDIQQIPALYDFLKDDGTLLSNDHTLTLFGDPSFFFQSSCDSGASTQPGCPLQDPGFAWNHGDIQPEIATTWQGWVGPGIRNLGVTSNVWTDHTDARPTMMTVLGLHDDYGSDGAAIAQIIGSAHGGWDPSSRGNNALPWSIRADERGYEDLAAAYKQLDAPFGEFGLGTLDADTTALATGGSSSDATYTGTTSQLQACESQRTALAAQVQPVMDAAENGAAPVSSREASSLIGRADRLIGDAKFLAGASTPPRFTVCS